MADNNTNSGLSNGNGAHHHVDPEKNCYHEDDEEGKKMVLDACERAKTLGSELTEAIEKKMTDEPATKKAKMSSSSEPYYKISDVKDGIIDYVPTKQMTGVDPEVTRICAAISQQLYHVETVNDFDLNLNDRKVEVLLYDNHGNLNAATPSTAVAVTGSTMIIGWRGSQNTMDFLVDATNPPLASRAWLRVAPSVRAQGSMLALIESDMSIHGDFLRNEIQTHRITDLIFTGHSLAGGMAQIAHLFVQGELMADNSGWNAVAVKQNFTPRTVAFSAPMTTVNLKRSDPLSSSFVNKVGETMSNIIFSSDVVPRGYACLKFIHEVIKSAIPDISRKVPVPSLLRWTFGVQRRLLEGYKSLADDQQALIEIWAKYRHIGRIIHYENEQAKPEVVFDKGFYYKPIATSRNNVKTFRDITYKTGDDVFQTLYSDHMFLITGPGLAFNVIKKEEDK